MGLALHSDSPDPLFSLTRHFPPESPRARRYHGRDKASLLRAVLERPASADALPAGKLDVRRRSSQSIPRRRPPRHGPCIHETDDDIIRLARSSVHLPTDGSRNRVPSLERQNAFRDPSTIKPPPVRSLSQGCEDEDPEVAELYRLGLLYDDEHVRGSGFDLNAIVRDEPTYTLAVRPPRRHRRGGHDGPAMKLPMDWTFPGLEEDDEVARYLLSEKSTDASAPARRGYRMVWRSAAPPAADAEFPDHFSDSASFYSIHRSAHSDFPPDFDFDDDDEMDWAVLPRDDDAALRTEDAATGTWVVLGDGS